MPPRPTWTDVEDKVLLAARSAGDSWSTVAWKVGKSRTAVIVRAQVLKPPAAAPTPTVSGREPLPPGHPTTWGAITTGTLLEGEPYHP